MNLITPEAHAQPVCFILSKMPRGCKFLLIYLHVIILIALTSPAVLSASPDIQNQPGQSFFDINQNKPLKWYEEIDAKWGGHVKVRGDVSWPDDESYFKPVGTGAYYDGFAELRLKNKLFPADWGYLETHYEAIYAEGDTRRKLNKLARFYPDLYGSLITGGSVEDNRRLMDLTKTICDNDEYSLHHRLDRLVLVLQPEWGNIRIGRQALTWGNGLLFNPMDLFNPFAPTDIDRDYKIGDDMITTQFSLYKTYDFQFLYVPRRDSDSHNVEWNDSSLAGKLHFVSGTTEFDIMAGLHYKDEVIGFGSQGYLGNTVWRMDATWTFLPEESGKNGYLSVVANMDYSWVWLKKNFYGFIEFYFNGLGKNNYTKAYADPDISERLVRGDMFSLGRTYLSGEIQAELNPLLNVYLTIINNLADPSGILQPRLNWDMAENTQLTFGANIGYGKTGTEYGGFKIDQTNYLNKPSDSAFLWLTYFF